MSGIPFLSPSHFLLKYHNDSLIMFNHQIYVIENILNTIYINFVRLAKP